MNILAIDPATNCGWALSRAGSVSAGTWKLASASEITAAGKSRLNRRLDPRIPRLWARISEVHAHTPLNWLVWEDVLFSSYTLQTMLWASFRTTLWIFAALHEIQTDCLDVKRLKLFATGHGGATKDTMAAALVRKDSRFILQKGLVFDTLQGISLTDDAVDALHLLEWAQKTFRKTIV